MRVTSSTLAAPHGETREPPNPDGTALPPGLRYLDRLSMDALFVISPDWYVNQYRREFFG